MQSFRFFSHSQRDALSMVWWCCLHGSRSFDCVVMLCVFLAMVIFRAIKETTPRHVQYAFFLSLATRLLGCCCCFFFFSSFLGMKYFYIGFHGVRSISRRRLSNGGRVSSETHWRCALSLLLSISTARQSHSRAPLSKIRMPPFF